MASSSAITRFTTYTLLVPLLEVRLDYRVVARQGTELERAVLRACDREGGLSAEALNTLLPLPRGAVARMLVDLMRWRCLAVKPVAHTSDVDYMLTPLGARIARGEELFPKNVLDRGYFTCFVDPLLGRLIHVQDVNYLTARQVTPGDGEELQSDQPDLREIRPADISFALQRQQAYQSREGRDQAGARYELESVNFQSWRGKFMSVTVYEGTAGSFVVGLPKRWTDCADAIKAYVAENRDSLASADIPESETAKIAVETGSKASPFPVAKNSLEIWSGNQRHLEALRQILECKAHSRVIIASAFLGDPRNVGIEQALLAALNRGVDVALIWGGYLPDSQKNASEQNFLAKGWARLAKRSEARGQLTCLLTPSKSHAKYLVWDEIDDRRRVFHCAVGSYNWLSTLAGGIDNSLANVSVSVRDPVATQRLVEHLQVMATLSTRSPAWSIFGNDLLTAPLAPPRQAASADTDKINVAWLFDGENVVDMVEMLSSAQSRLSIASHRTGQVAEHRLIPITARSGALGFTPIVLHEKSFDSPKVSCMDIRARSPMHSKFIVADDMAIVSSHNFLATDPGMKSKFGQEIGLKIWDVAISHQLYAMAFS